MPGTPSQFEKTRNTFHGSWCFHLPSLTLATGDVLTNFTPGFAGSIVKAWLVVTTAVTSATTANLAYNLEINVLNIVGGIVTISTNAVAGTVINGTVIKGSNNFDKDDTISLEVVVTTAATGGTAILVVEYEGKVG